VTLEAWRSSLLLLWLLLLLLLLLLVSLGVITPRWSWWRRDRRTDAPLCAMGLGAGLLGLPAVLCRFEGAPKRATRQLNAAYVASPPPTPRSYLGRRHRFAAPLPLSKGLRAMARLALRATPAGWGPPTGALEIRIPRWGSRPLAWRTVTPLSSRVGSVAKIVVLRPGSS
jgi:hypothetical protein